MHDTNRRPSARSISLMSASNADPARKQDPVAREISYLELCALDLVERIRELKGELEIDK